MMSNIIENLQKILSARFGRDVRQAIHDAIHDCYEDGKAGAIDLVARERLDDVESDVDDLQTNLNDLIKFRDISVTTAANTASKLGFYGSLSYSYEGYRPISFTVVGGSGFRGYVTYNFSGGAYLWAESAGTYTVRIYYVKAL